MGNSVILAARKFDRFSSLLSESGFEVINFPTIETVRADDLSDLEAKLAEIEEFDGVFFTSPVAAEVFLEKFDPKKREFRGKFYVLGKRADRLLKSKGFATVFFEEANTALEMINSLPVKKLKYKRFLFPQGDKSLRVIPKILEDIAEVEETIVYKTVKPKFDERTVKEIAERLSRGEIDFACFFSPSGLENFLEIFGKDSLKETNIAAIGQTTARRARENDLATDFVSKRASAEDFARGLIEHIRTKNIE